MTFEEYLHRIACIDKKRDGSITKLNKEFAISNAKFNIGDTITDTDYKESIIIMEITSYGGTISGVPVCNYRGPRLKKDLSPYKSGEWDSLLGSKDLIKVNT